MKLSPKAQKVQDEVFYRLILANAQDGTFNLGELKSGKEALSIAKHLRGVSEIIATAYTEEEEK
jgi:hypothetical protein